MADVYYGRIYRRGDPGKSIGELKVFGGGQRF